VEVATQVTESIRNQGPLDIDGLEMEIRASEMTVNSETVRWLVGKEVKITSKGDIYGRKWPKEKYESLLDDMLEREYHKNLIYLAIKAGCESVREISEKTGLDLMRVSYLLADLEKTNLVAFRGMKEKRPIFAAL